MKIGVIGLGFVGLTFASVLASKGYSVIGVDYDKSKIVKIESGKAPFFEPRLDETLEVALQKDLKISPSISSVVDTCDIIFVTVGTPTLEKGGIDLSMIESVIKEIGILVKKIKNDPVIVIKSTVVPGTTQKLIDLLEQESGKKNGESFGIITNPEFLREGMAVEDTINPHLIVLGGIDDKYLKRLIDFYSSFQPKVQMIKTNPQTAEIIKYANNSFLATKISFINQIASICEAVPGANIEEVAKAIGVDPRIGTMFLNAGPGYGGSCLPKDVKAIINFSSKIGVNSTLLDAVEEVNQNQVKNITSIIKKTLGNLGERKISILGLAFKPDTDDIRESVSLKLIEILLKEGAKIMVHDPKAIENTKSVFGNKIEYTENVSEVLRDSECGVIMTAWKQYTDISEKELELMKKRFIVDTRRLLFGKKLNIEYHAIGIG